MFEVTVHPTTMAQVQACDNWCIEHGDYDSSVPPDEAWDADSGWDIVEVFYYFENEHNAILFKLSFADYL